MASDLRPRRVKKNFMPLLFYGLPRELLLLVGELAAARSQHRDGRQLMEETAALVSSERSSALERPCCPVCRGS